MDVMELSALSRRHYARLSWYWRHRSVGGADSRADGVDLELIGLKAIVRAEKEIHGNQFKITPFGEELLAAEHEREKARRQPHHNMGTRLATWLREQKRITWENIQVLASTEQGPMTVRPDVYSLATTCRPERFAPLVHEIKVSRSDFLADIAKPDKRGGYALVAESMYYVTPVGLVTLDEVPAECGLVVEGEPGRFDVVKKAPKKKVILDARQLMNLVLKQGTLNPL